MASSQQAQCASYLITTAQLRHSLNDIADATRDQRAFTELDWYVEGKSGDYTRVYVRPVDYDLDEAFRTFSARRGET